jgi:hypothetical protein
MSFAVVIRWQHSPNIDFSTMVLRDVWLARAAEALVDEKKPFGRVINATDNSIPSEITMIKRYVVNPRSLSTLFSRTRTRTIGQIHLRWRLNYTIAIRHLT